MRLRGGFTYSIAIIMVIMSCASPKSTTVSSKSQYSEDLSVWRPKVETPATNGTDSNGSMEPKQTQYIEPKYAVNKKLDTVLDSIDRYNIAREFIEGFTIQVYTGLKREDALNAKKNLSISFPDLQSEVEYSQPNFRVKVGQYFNRIDAQRDYGAVKKYFPTAIIVPDKVSIK